MLLDTRAADSSVAVGAGHDWQQTRAAVAGHRSAAGFLTLPELPTSIPVKAEYRRRGNVSFNELVLAQFKHGPLRAADVNNPVDSGDAFQQAFFAWLGREIPSRERMKFTPCLLDSNAVDIAISYLDNRNEFADTSPLYLAMEMEEEWMCSIGDCVEELNACHPLLIYTMLCLIESAGCRTCWVRTPGWFLYEFSSRYWDGDEGASDEDVKECFEATGEDADSEDIQRYLPSNVLPTLYPDAFRNPERIPGRRRGSRILSEQELLALRKKCRGLPRTVCTELIYLSRAIRALGRRSPLTEGFEGRPVYAACSVVLQASELTGEIIDDYFEYASNGGDYSTHASFIPLANSRVAIRRQYRDWAYAFQVTRHLDRLLALVAHPV
ncbi:MAG: PRTRC system protein F [Pseudomonadota bacterium]